MAPTSAWSRRGRAACPPASGSSGSWSGSPPWTPRGARSAWSRDVEAGTAHDVLVVDGREGERRFPMVSAFVREVDIQGGRVVLTPWDEEEA